MRYLPLIILMVVLSARAGENGPIASWRFDAGNTADRTVKPLAGKLNATISGPVKFSNDAPQAVVLNGDSKSGQRIVLAEDFKTASLPAKTLSAEAWVYIEKTQEWGGIVGALQDNGNDEKGWLLGYSDAQFFFALASKKSNKLTYLKAQQPFQTGCWYHVTGTYDGTVLRVYVDGKLQGASREQSGDILYPPEGFFTAGAYHDKDELYPMNGRLHGVSVYNRALSPQEIAAHFNAQHAEFPGALPIQPDVVDWPTYLRDGQRTAHSPENLMFPLHLKWTHATRFAPKPAWAEEAKNDYYNKRFNIEERVIYDRGFHLVGVGNLVCFGSSADDKVYALDADTGVERWSFCTEGPVRLAPVIDNGRVLFGSDDGFVYCVNAADGKLVWKQMLAPDGRRIPGNERIISAWPVRTGIYVEDGKVFCCAGIFASQGVYEYTLNLTDGAVIDRKQINSPAQGYLRRFFGKLQVATGRNPAGAFVADLKTKGKDAGPAVSTLPKEFSGAFIGAGEARIGGGENKIAAFSADDGKELWSAPVDGTVRSIAVVGGRLLASTDKGRFYCFTPEKTEAVAIVPPLPLPRTVPGIGREPFVDRIINESGTKRGYCLVLGADHDLIDRIAHKTEWHIVCREADAQKVEQLRRAIDQTNLSTRVFVHHGPVNALPYTDYLFNAVVACGGGINRAEAQRVTRPGGVSVLGPADADVIRRGPVAGGGEWTHLYGEPGNSGCSGDTVVTGDKKLLIQWFGPPGPRTMIDRHHRTAAPLYKDGRLFVPGEDRVTAVDAYNGTILWDKEIPKSRRVVVFRDSSYIALSANALYVATATECLALDPQTGREIERFSIPTKDADANSWGYLASISDLIVGSAVKPSASRRDQSHLLTTTETHWDFVPIVGSDSLFVIDRKTGKVLWTYPAKNGLIINPTITSDGSTLYFVESDNAETVNNPAGRSKLESLVGNGAHVTALDLKTGKVLWSRPEDSLKIVRHNLFASVAKDRLVLAGSYNSGTDKKTARLMYEICVMDAKTGEKVWSKTQKQFDPIGGEHGEQERHPTIVNGVLYCEPFAYDLLSGTDVAWKWPWTTKSRRGCGTFSASASCFFFRDQFVTLFDLKTQLPRNVTAETRPGCWINLLPVGGLLLSPEASSGCTCNFAVQTSIAFMPQPGFTE